MASFQMDFSVWAKAMRDKILKDIPESEWKTTRVLIVTSVGHEEVVAIDGDALAQLTESEHQTK